MARLPDRRQLLTAMLLLPMGLAAQEQPLRYEGFDFQRQVVVAGNALRLNGVGMRAVAWFKGYAAALYLREAATTAAQAVAQAGPKRLQLCMLQNVPAAEFVKAFRKGMHRNTPPDEHGGLAERMLQFATLVQALDQVRKGDVVDLDFVPGRGTLFSLNGTLQGQAVEGEDFYAALLRSFVGEKPYDRELRAGLLGQGG